MSIFYSSHNQTKIKVKLFNVSTSRYLAPGLLKEQEAPLDADFSNAGPEGAEALEEVNITAMFGHSKENDQISLLA